MGRPTGLPPIPCAFWQSGNVVALASISDVKGILKIPTSDTADDLVLRLWLDAVEANILEWTGYSLTALTGHTQVFERVERGRTLTLDKRPISALAITEVAVFGSTDWTTLDASIVDAAKGTIIIEPSGSLWPPTETDRSTFIRNHRVWDLVRVTTNVSALTTIPKSLQQFAASLTAYLYQQGDGAVKSSRIGLQSEEYREEDIPYMLRPFLQPHLRPSEVAQWVA